MDIVMSSYVFGLLFLASASFSHAQVSDYSGASEVEYWYNISRIITLECPLSVSAGQQVLWYRKNDNRNETNVVDDPALKDRYSVTEKTFVIEKSVEDDYGYYVCKVGTKGARFFVRGVQHVKLPDNTVVVEEEDVKMVCHIYGKPYDTVLWLYTNGTEDEEVTLEGLERITLEKNDKGAENGKLTIKSVRKSDAGVYSCLVGSSRAKTELRVRDKYAAVWPFLGIVAEVLILCVIILVYEKRRTKPEMEDSDTEHDQKQS